MFCRLMVALLLVAAGAAEVPVVYVGDGNEHRIAAIAVDGAGNTYVTGARVLKSSASKTESLSRNWTRRTRACGSSISRVRNRRPELLSR
jgi:hypothetical protein